MNKKQEKYFAHGIAYSAGYLMRWHGEETYAAELLKTAFKSWDEVMSSGIDEYDLENLAPLKPYLDRMEAKNASI